MRFYAAFPAILFSLLAVFVVGAPAAEKRPRIALMNFTPEKNFNRDKIAAEHFTATLQAQLSSTGDGADWVERNEIDKAESELHLQKFGFIDNAGLIRGGKWVKADLSILGSFSHNSERKRVLYLDFLDLDRADVLLRETILLNVNSDELLENSLSQLPIVSMKIKSLLPKATNELQRVREQKKLAFLFFANNSVDSKFARLEEEFDTRLTTALATNRQLRIIRFPRSADAADEAALAFSGMVDSQVSAESIADYFVWGSFNVKQKSTFNREIKGWDYFNVYDVQLNVFDGKNQPIQLKRTFEKVQPDVAALLEEGLKEAAQSTISSNRNVSARAEIANAFVQRALEQIRMERSQLKLFNLIKVIESACFFDPGNREAADLQLRYRWGREALEQSNYRFRFMTQKSEAWGRFVDRFGLPTGTNANFFEQYIDTALRPIEEFKSSRYTLTADGVPLDAGKTIVSQWRASLAQEFVKRIGATIDRPELEPRLLQILAQALNIPGGPTQPIEDHELRARFIELMAPALKKLAQKDNQMRIDRDSRCDIVATFIAVGRPDYGRKLLEELRQEQPQKDWLTFAPTVTQLRRSVGNDATEADTVEKQLEKGVRYQLDENYQQASEMYLKAANSGNAAAQFALGQLYDYGHLSENLREQAIPWYQKAAAQGHEQAIAELIMLAEHGKTPFDLGMLQTSAAHGNLDAQWFLAKRFQTGKGVPQNDSEAFQWFMKAAKNGGSVRVADAMYEVGLMYEEGRAVSKDLTKAREWFLEATMANGYAQEKVARMLETGDGFPRDITRAAQLYYAAATSDATDRRRETSHALLNLLLQHGGEIANGMERSHFFQNAISLNESIGTTENTRRPGRAKRMSQPKPVLPTNIESAVRIFTNAASAAKPLTQYQVGQMYEQGLAGEIDLVQAAQWYDKAATAGSAEAQYRLGLFYRDGHGVPPDPVIAYRWFSIAIVQGIIEANDARNRLRTTMTSEQIQKAEKESVPTPTP